MNNYKRGDIMKMWIGAGWKGVRMSLDLEKMCEEIKREGVVSPQIGIVTPEIRTVDERVQFNVKVIESVNDIDTK